MFRILAVAASIVSAALPAWAAGDVALGEKAFMKCKACHDIKDGINRVGPSLKGVVGRQAGAIADFNYSDANKNSGLTWDEATLKEYLKNPKAKMPGTKMMFGGIKNDAEIDNIIAFLATQK